MKRVSLNLYPAVFLMLLVCSGIDSKAALLAYEGFDYAAGPITGTGAGTDLGFADAWIAGANSGNVVSTGLTYGNLQVSGGAGDFSQGAGDSSADTTTNFRSFDVAYNGPEDSSTGEVWWSYLIQPGAFTGTPFGGLSFYTGVSTTDTDFATATRNNGGSLNFGFSDLDVTSNLLNTGINAVNGETTLFVARIVLGGGSNTSANNEDRIYLYINPELGNGTPAMANANANVTANFQTIRFASQNGQPFILDEFRFGETFADVTPTTIPEPAAWTALALVAMAGALQRFRRWAAM